MVRLHLHTKNSENPIAHFVNTSRNIPIWALFETLSLGDTANFIKALDVSLRTKMMKNIGIYDPIHDPSGGPNYKSYLYNQGYKEFNCR